MITACYAYKHTASWFRSSAWTRVAYCLQLRIGCADFSDRLCTLMSAYLLGTHQCLAMPEAYAVAHAIAAVETTAAYNI